MQQKKKIPQDTRAREVTRIHRRQPRNQHIQDTFFQKTIFLKKNKIHLYLAIVETKISYRHIQPISNFSLLKKKYIFSLFEKIHIYNPPIPPHIRPYLSISNVTNENVFLKKYIFNFFQIEHLRSPVLCPQNTWMRELKKYIFPHF